MNTSIYGLVKFRNMSGNDDEEENSPSNHNLKRKCNLLAIFSGKMRCYVKEIKFQYYKKYIYCHRFLAKTSLGKKIYIYYKV